MDKIAYTWIDPERPQDRYIVVPMRRTIDWDARIEADDALGDFWGRLVGAAQDRALAKLRADGVDVIDITGQPWPAGYNVVKWLGRNGYQPIGEGASR